MNELATTRTLPIIATEINSIKDQTRNMILCSSIEIGRRLAEAKSLVEHGEWGEWLKSSVDYSKSTANNLMRIFEEYGADQIPLFGDNSKSQALGNLSYTQAVALLGVTPEEREEFVEKTDIEHMSTRELQQVIKERDDLKRKQEKLKNTVTKISGERDKLRGELEKERQQTKTEVDRLTGLLNEAKKNGSSDEKLKQLETELEAAQSQVQELTEKINEPVTLEPAVIEKVPEDIEQELNNLRKQAEESETNKQTNAAILKYGVYFETLVTGFKNLLEALAEIEDQEAHEKYKNAVSGLLSKMSAKL